VSRRLPALHAVVEFGIGADAVVADEDARRNGRVIRCRLLDFRNDRVIAVGDAEQELVIRPVQAKGARQRLGREVLDAANGNDDGDGRFLAQVRWWKARCLEPPAGDENAGEVGRNEGARCKGEGLSHVHSRKLL